MKCPVCNSDNVYESGKFDLTLIDPQEARHDFECGDCEALFQIIYHPVATKLIEKGEVI